VLKVKDCAKRAIILKLKIENAEGIAHNFSSLLTFPVYPGYDQAESCDGFPGN
jgi:hypothetical protein